MRGVNLGAVAATCGGSYDRATDTCADAPRPPTETNSIVNRLDAYNNALLESLNRMSDHLDRLNGCTPNKKDEKNPCVPVSGGVLGTIFGQLDMQDKLLSALVEQVARLERI